MNLSEGVIENAFVAGTMSADNKSGIINWYDGNKETLVKNSYFLYQDLGIQKTQASCSRQGFGTTWFTDSVENSYGLTADELLNLDSFVGWDLTRIWKVTGGVPELRFLDYWTIPGYEESMPV